MIGSITTKLSFAVGLGALATMLQVREPASGANGQNNVWFVSLNPAIQDHASPDHHESLAWILARVGSESAKVVLRGSHVYPLLHGLTVPEHVSLEFHAGAILDLGTGTNLDLRAEFGLPRHQIFTGDGTVFIRQAPYILPQWFGATGDGLHDDTASIQKALDAAGQMFNQVAFPPAGDDFTPPIVLFGPGSYRLTGELVSYTGLTLTGVAANPYTAGHTRLIMDLPGNNENILRLTRNYQGSPRGVAVTTTIQDLGFWYVTLGCDILNPLGGPGYGNDDGYFGAPLYQGCGIYIEEPSADTRIKRCNFAQCPNSAIYLTSTGSFSNVIIDECEFDAGNRFISAANTRVDLEVHDSKFFSGLESIRVIDCTGRVFITGSAFYCRARVVVLTSALDAFTFTANDYEGIFIGDDDEQGCMPDGGFLHVDKANTVTVSANTIGRVTESAINLMFAKAGSVTGNTIDNAGMNSNYSAANLAPAAIRLSGCENVLVAGNSISTTSSSGTFPGFGVLTEDNGMSSSGNFVTSNLVTASYAKERKICVTAKDIVGLNEAD